MDCSRLLSRFLAVVTGAAVLVVPAVVGAAAEVQPCVVTYADTVADTSFVTDVDVSWDISHVDAAQVSLHVIKPGLATGPLDRRYSFDDEAGKDTLLAVATTNDKGRKTSKAPARSGRHDVRVEASYAAGQPECGRARTSQAPVPQRRTALRVVLLDTDGDGLDDAVDGCPTVASATSTGCPSASRNVSLKWLAGQERLQVRVSSSVAGCSQRARIALFRVRPHQDYKVLGGAVSFSGQLRIKVARGARYYVSVPQSYASGVAECGKAESRKVLAPRG